MPRIRVLYWNLQNLGETNTFREFAFPRMAFVAYVATAADVDVICIQEVKALALGGGYLEPLQEALNERERALGRPAHWYYDVIKGALDPADGIPPPATKPFNRSADLVWDGGHHEGYAIFWRQNIAKFTVLPAPPIRPPGALGDSVNSQSAGTRCPGRAGMMPVGGMAVPAGGIQVPPGLLPYVVSQGTSINGGAALLNDTPYASLTALGAGTVVGPNGIWLSVATHNVNPIVIPGGYVLGTAKTLPATPDVLVPEHVASLVLFGRPTSDPLLPSVRVTDLSALAADFAPGGTQWNWLEFTRSNAAPAGRVLSRRPAYFTIDVNRGGGALARARLVPIIVYHAPSVGQAAISGMQRSAYSQPMYQAYDPGTPGWINCDNALIGGDFNVENNGGYAYPTFTNGFAGAMGFGGGANATQLVQHPVGGAYNPADPLNRSIVAFRQGFTHQGPEIFSKFLVDYRKSAIDNIFYRGLGNVLLVFNGVIDLLSAVTGGAADVTAAIQNFANLPLLIDILDGRNPFLLYVHDPLCSALDVQAGRFRLTIEVGNSTGPRRAAEFLRLFVSDHLPAVIQFTM